VRLRLSLVIILAVSLGSGCRREAANSAPANRPNVLFILLDDLRWDTVGYVNFRNAFATTSLCSPSRASLLSGLYAHRHGVTNNFTEFPESLDSFPRALQRAGYATAYVGKYHMGENNDAPRPGFDYFVTHKGQGQYFGTEFNLNGERRETPSGYYTTVVTDIALDWLKRDHAGKPWMLILGHKAPHSFYTPEPKYAHAFDDVRVPYPTSAFELQDKPTWIKERMYTWHGIYGPLFDWRKKFPDDRPEGVRDFENMVPTGRPYSASMTTSAGFARGWNRQDNSRTPSSCSAATTACCRANTAWSTSGRCTSRAFAFRWPFGTRA
jgi:N-acetylglucosamine-6-sulfatase